MVWYPVVWMVPSDVTCSILRQVSINQFFGCSKPLVPVDKHTPRPKGPRGPMRSLQSLPMPPTWCPVKNSLNNRPRHHTRKVDWTSSFVLQALLSHLSTRKAGSRLIISEKLESRWLMRPSQILCRKVPHRDCQALPVHGAANKRYSFALFDLLPLIRGRYSDQQLKCSREHPICVRCKRLGGHCFYPRPHDRRRQRADPVIFNASADQGDRLRQKYATQLSANADGETWPLQDCPSISEPGSRTLANQAGVQADSFQPSLHAARPQLQDHVNVTDSDDLSTLADLPSDVCSKISRIWWKLILASHTQASCERAIAAGILTMQPSRHKLQIPRYLLLRQALAS
jgi:hypothetical protein